MGARKGNIKCTSSVGGIGEWSKVDFDDTSVPRELVIVVSEKRSGNWTVCGDGSLWGEMLDPKAGGEMDCGKGLVIEERAWEGVDQDGGANGRVESAVDGMEQVAR